MQGGQGGGTDKTIELAEMRVVRSGPVGTDDVESGPHTFGTCTALQHVRQVRSGQARQPGPGGPHPPFASPKRQPPPTSTFPSSLRSIKLGYPPHPRPHSPSTQTRERYLMILACPTKPNSYKVGPPRARVIISTTVAMPASNNNSH